MARTPEGSRDGRLSSVAAATPATRDRYVDLLRAVSIVVVVLGHWLMAIVYQRDGRLYGDNALDVIPGLWLATWLLQVMPLFFFVGGFSNLMSWEATTRRGETYGRFLQTRVDRLLRPTLVFIAVWLCAAAALDVASPSFSGSLEVASQLVAKPLWFLAVYVLVTAVTPLMLAVHRRHGGRVLAVMAIGAVIADVVRIGWGLTAVGYLNFAFVWLFAHQLGFFYADGTFLRKPALFFTRMAGLGLTLLIALTSTGIYSPSMVGVATDKASNNSPPSVCLIALTVWLVGVAMRLREPATRWLARRRVWEAVVAANSIIMTVFLWHLTALFVAVIVLYPAGFPQPVGGSALWWAWRPIWIATLVVFLIPFIAVFARFEVPTVTRRHESRTSRRSDPVVKRRVAVAVACLVAGLAGVAEYGFDLDGRDAASGIPLIPVASAALAALGYRLISAGGLAKVRA